MLKNKVHYFFSQDFKLFPGVYIPKHETEYIITIVEDIYHKFYSNQAINLLEVGPGSGCISISLAKMLPLACIFAIEIQEIAYRNTQHNCIKHSVYVNLTLGDIFKINNTKLACFKFDILVCNPPYLNNAEFNIKHINTKDNNIRNMDYINCVGDLDWIMRLLDLSLARYVVLEMSQWQAKIIKHANYTVLSIFTPFVNSKISFVTLYCLNI